MAVLLSSLSCQPKVFSSSSSSSPPILCSVTQWKPSTFGSNSFASPNQLRTSRLSFGSVRSGGKNGRAVKAFFFNPFDESIVKEALKEPVAFMGGVFAGLLRLDLNEDPLKEWVSRTVEASGITPQDIEAEGSNQAEEEVPQQIEIE